MNWNDYYQLLLFVFSEPDNVCFPLSLVLKQLFKRVVIRLDDQKDMTPILSINILLCKIKTKSLSLLLLFALGHTQHICYKGFLIWGRRAKKSNFLKNANAETKTNKRVLFSWLSYTFCLSAYFIVLIDFCIKTNIFHECIAFMSFSTEQRLEER